MKYLALIILLTGATVALAQTSSSNNNPPIMPLWDAPIPPESGAYSVSLNSICSVALERYDLEFRGKTYPVVECSVETVGGKTARFYYVRESKDEKEDQATPLSQAKAQIKSATDALQGKEEDDEKKKTRVVKIYPESTLANTVEFRLLNEQKVVELYTSLRQAWVSAAP